MKIVGPNFSKNQKYPNKHLPKTMSTKYSTELTTQKAGKYLKVWERKTRVHQLAHLLAWYYAPSYYLKMLDIQKWICRIVALLITCFLSCLAHHWNIASLSLFMWYFFGRCSSELVQLVPLPYSQGRSSCYFDRLHDFSVTIPRCYKDVYVNSFFPRTARLWNCQSIECFPLTYNLNGCKYRIKRQPLSVGSF